MIESNYFGYAAAILSLVSVALSDDKDLEDNIHIVNYISSILWMTYAFYTRDLISTLFYFAYLVFFSRSIYEKIKKVGNKSDLF